MSAPTFPPLLRGLPASDPFAAACAEAAGGGEPGTVAFDVRSDLAAAIVLAPEVALEGAMAMWPACGLALRDALGALGPPEMAVAFDWEGGLRVEDALCGRVRAAASTRDPEAVPDWLVVGIAVAWRLDLAEPGLAPGRTALMEEGCGDLSPARLLESWSRHLLFWIHRWEEDGAAPLHAEWQGSLADLRPPARALGLDERFGLLLRAEAGPRLVPLSSRLEAPPDPTAAARGLAS